MITLKVSQKMFPNQNQHGKSYKNVEISNFKLISSHFFRQEVYGKTLKAVLIILGILIGCFIIGLFFYLKNRRQSQNGSDAEENEMNSLNRPQENFNDISIAIE